MFKIWHKNTHALLSAKTKMNVVRIYPHPTPRCRPTARLLSPTISVPMMSLFSPVYGRRFELTPTAAPPPFRQWSLSLASRAVLRRIHGRGLGVSAPPPSSRGVEPSVSSRSRVVFLRIHGRGLCVPASFPSNTLLRHTAARLTRVRTGEER